MGDISTPEQDEFRSKINSLNELPDNDQVTVKKARRILGKQAESLTDTQVQQMLLIFKLLAREQLSYNGSKKEA